MDVKSPANESYDRRHDALVFVWNIDFTREHCAVHLMLEIRNINWL